MSLLSGILQLVAGAAAVATGILLEGVTFGASSVAVTPYLISAGAGMMLSGIGTLLTGAHSQGFSTLIKNPIAPWRYIYGQARVGGDLVYLSTWGANNQMLDMVMVLAAHPCESIDAVLFDSSHIAIDQKGVVGAFGAGQVMGLPLGYHRPTQGGSSYTPVQQSGDRAVSITNIARDYDVVTVQMASAIPSLMVGDTVTIQDSGSGTAYLANAGLTGMFQVAELLDGLVTKFTYLNGGPSVTLSGVGKVSTNWKDLGRLVYFEYMLGNQAIGECFNGMAAGTPWLGAIGFSGSSGLPPQTPQFPQISVVDPSLSNQNTAGEAPGWVGAPNPWNRFCSLAGKTCVFLRLTHGKTSSGSNPFQAGIPQIAFLVHGKNDIYDPRLGAYGAPGTAGYTNNAALAIADFLHLGSTKGAPWSLTSPPTVYSAGDLVSYQNVDYISCANSNTTAPPDPAYWTPIYNPSIWNATTAYPKGALVTLNATLGADLPGTWNVTYNYGIYAPVIYWDFEFDGSGNLIQQNCHQYISLQAVNSGNYPDGGTPGGSNPTWWKLYDGAIEFVSLVDNNVNIAPLHNPGSWRILPYLVTKSVPEGYCAPYVDPAAVPGAPWNSINTPSLMVAADVCDELVALARGGYEPRYTCDGAFTANMLPGEILRNLLTSCAGRLTYVGGQYFIQPGYWIGVGSPPLAVDLQAIAAGPFRWRPIVSVRELYNGVKGTYISPSNRWESSDFPYYAQDTLHGYNGPAQYGGDINLEQDGGRRRWLDVHLPFTISYSMAQRIAKIELLRRRHYGTGTFTCNMSAYYYTALDVIEATQQFLNWAGRVLEVSAVRFKAEYQASQGGGKDSGAMVFTIELDLQDTDSDIYVWSVLEELSPQGYEQLAPLSPTAIEALPYPWSPGYAKLSPGDALAPGSASFGLTPIYGNDANGALTANLILQSGHPFPIVTFIPSLR